VKASYDLLNVKAYNLIIQNIYISFFIFILHLFENSPADFVQDCKSSEIVVSFSAWPIGIGN